MEESSGREQPDWAEIVAQIMAGDERGAKRLYVAFDRGLRWYLARQCAPEDLEDVLNETFLIVTSAIRRGDVREPIRIMGFVRTVARRQVAAYIEGRVFTRTRHESLGFEHLDPEGLDVPSNKPNPEHEMLLREKAELMARCLEELGERDRELLKRFYLREQPANEIMRDMNLTETQFRLMKSRAKAKFGEAGKRRLAGRGRPILQFACELAE